MCLRVHLEGLFVQDGVVFRIIGALLLSRGDAAWRSGPDLCLELVQLPAIRAERYKSGTMPEWKRWPSRRDTKLQQGRGRAQIAPKLAGTAIGFIGPRAANAPVAAGAERRPLQPVAGRLLFSQAGRIFWFMRKRLSGSYLRFTWVRRS